MMRPRCLLFFKDWFEADELTFDDLYILRSEVLMVALVDIVEVC